MKHIILHGCLKILFFKKERMTTKFSRKNTLNLLKENMSMHTRCDRTCLRLILTLVSNLTFGSFLTIIGQEFNNHVPCTLEIEYR